MPNFKNTTRNKKLTGSTGNDSIINTARGATLNGGSGGDTIRRLPVHCRRYSRHLLDTTRV